MAALKISVLGTLQVSAGTAIQHKFESNKVRGLLAYLAVEMDRPHSREVLAEILWPESPAQTSLANLRYALADLRKVIGDENANPPYLIVSRETLQFNVSSDCELDLAVFTQLLRSNEIEKLKQGLALYHCDFLAGFPSIESNAFEEWITLKREQFKRQAVEALRLVTDHHEGRGEYQQALPFARRQVELEPWLEEAHQQLMRVLALDGQRSAALAQYETCRRVLDLELGAPPTPETTRLYESIRDGTLEKVHPLLKREPPAPGDPPFKGLQCFDETDADLFFGREALVSHLVEQIRSREKVKGLRFLAVIGASGSGKSSLVRAGLIPALKREARSLIAQVITPTEHPLSSLRGANGVSDDREASRREAIPASQRRLLRRSAARNDELLFVDQFEELFTLCQSESERKSFINKLLEAAKETSVIITLRADFYAACAPYENLRNVLSQNQEYIGPMNAGELRRAIEEPARVNGWLFEPGLTDLLLHDIGAEGERSPEPGALPLLSHALLETWHRRSGRMLTLAGYAEAGKIAQAITKTAESVFAQFSAEEKSVARNIFLRLTELGEGTQETRRRVQLSEIIPPPELGKGRAETVLKMLSDARLVITTEATAEVAHEALIREWDRLHEWLTENREGLRLHRHVTESAREWESHGHDAELTYRGARLAQALDWAENHAEDLNLLEREFLKTSKALAEREAAEREAGRQRELEAARKLAESERQRAEGQTRTSKQLRQRAYSLAGILALALVLAVVAFVQRNAASRQAHLASARELALASINNLDVDTELSILLALQAIEESEKADVPIPYEVQDALHRAIQASRIQYTLTAHSDVSSVAFSPDGKLLATAGSDNTAKLWDAATGKELKTLEGHTQIINDIAFSPNGQMLATVSDDKTVKIWDIESGQELQTFIGHTDIIWSVSFSGDGKFLATGGYTEAKVWNVDTGELILNLEGQRGPVAFSPATNQLATASLDGTTTIWNSTTWKEELFIPYDPNALVFSPDGTRLATARIELKIWDVTSGEELVSATGFAAIVREVRFSPDGTRLATAGQDGSVIVWDAETGSRLISLAGHAGAVNDVDFSPDCVSPPNYAFEWCGMWLATAGRDGTARVWDVSPGGSHELVTLPGFEGGFLEGTRLFTVRFISPMDVEIQTWDLASDGKSKRISNVISSHEAPIVAGNISPDETRLVTVDLSNTVKVWSATTGEELSAFAVNHTEPVTGIAFSADGSRIATSSDDGTVKIWDTASGGGLLTLSNHTAPVIAFAFNSDGTRIATAGADGIAKVWETSSGKEVLTLTGHTLPLYAVSFSPDGKRIATAGMDQTARIWDAATGENLLTLSGHTASVLAVAFSPDGSLLATSGHDATARIWDSTNGKELLTLTGHDGYINYVSFSPDGKRLVSGSFQDATMRVYLLDIMDVAALSRSRLTRSFTLEECQKYLHLSACP